MDKLYISRKAAMYALMCEASTHSNPVKRAYTRAAAIVAQIAVEDVQPVKHGKWLKRMSTSDSLKCSVCGNNHEYPTTYCPNCGVRMDGNAA